MTELKSYIQDSATKLGYEAWKPEQEEAITQFILGRDIFVALPTGYGNSLCYSCLLYVFDLIMCKEKHSIMVVSPLVALMKDQG